MTEYKAIVLGSDGYSLTSKSELQLNDYFEEGWIPYKITAQTVGVSTGSTTARIKYAPILVILKKDTVEL